MESEKKTAELHALLFVHGEPLNFKKVQKALGFSDEEMKQAALSLKAKLEDESSGLSLICDESFPAVFENPGWPNAKIQLVTKPEYGSLLSEFVKEEMGEELTPASLDVLSIVSYLGPISRANIEYIRGVNSIFTLRNLMIRGLVERMPDPKNQNAYLYRPTLDFIKHLGISAKEDLPEYEKFKQLLSQSEQNQNSNAGS